MPCFDDSFNNIIFNKKESTHIKPNVCPLKVQNTLIKKGESDGVIDIDGVVKIINRPGVAGAVLQTPL